VIAATTKGIVVELQWRESTSTASRELFQVLRLRASKVFDMEDHRDRQAALKAVGAVT